MAFKTIVANSEVVKPESLIQPLIGVLVERKQGKYSPIYVIKDDQGNLNQVRGCTDLDNKLRSVVDGSRVLIKYEKSVSTKNGNDMIIMLVQVDVQDIPVVPNILSRFGVK